MIISNVSDDMPLIDRNLGRTVVTFFCDASDLFLTGFVFSSGIRVESIGSPWPFAAGGELLSIVFAAAADAASSPLSMHFS